MDRQTLNYVLHGPPGSVGALIKLRYIHQRVFADLQINYAELLRFETMITINIASMAQTPAALPVKFATYVLKSNNILLIIISASHVYMAIHRLPGARPDARNCDFILLVPKPVHPRFISITSLDNISNHGCVKI